MKIFVPVVAAGVFLCLTGCAYIGPSEDAKAKQHYEEYGPKLSQADKAQMTTEEMAAVYNNEVREEDRLVCRRERAVGSHFRRTVCYTREEIDAQQENAEETMRQYRRGGGYTPFRTDK